MDRDSHARRPTESVAQPRLDKSAASIGPIDRERVKQAMDDIREIRKHTKPVSLAEILSARDEGRK
jgi:hypothetical protein